MIDMDDAALRQRATELSIETFYWDNDGVRHEADAEALRRVVEIVEADYSRSQGRRTHPIVLGSPARVYVGDCQFAELRLADGTRHELAVGDDHALIPEPLPIGSHTLALSGAGVEETTTIVVAPDRMPRSDRLAGCAALFAPAYALWERDAPLPSFAHLAALGRALPALGADVLVTLPLYAGFLDEPYDPSPYAPVSRLHWNEVYLDDAGLPAAPIPPLGEHIDWRTLAKRRRRQLLAAAIELLGPAGDGVLAARLSRWVAGHPDIADYARFRATDVGDPEDAGHDRRVVETSHQLAQFLATEQIAALEREGSAALALDLPIGSHPGGYETWAHPDLFAPGIAVGAPPDPIFAEGQNWGFPPQLPGEAERTGFDLWRQVVNRCGSPTSLLRIDHILGLHRLWWIPDGMPATKGVYVRYPRHALTAVIAAEATRVNTTVVGENLGTVPQEIVELMEQWNILGLYAEQLHDGELTPIPANSVAGYRTHDMPSFAADMTGERAARYRAALAAAGRRPVGSTPAEVLGAALDRLAGSDAFVAFADLDDLIGELRPHNVPGRVLPGTWCRRLAAPTSETLARPAVVEGLRRLSQRSGHVGRDIAPRPGGLGATDRTEAVE